MNLLPTCFMRSASILQDPRISFLFNFLSLMEGVVIPLALRSAVFYQMSLVLRKPLALHRRSSITLIDNFFSDIHFRRRFWDIATTIRPQKPFWTHICIPLIINKYHRATFHMRKHHLVYFHSNANIQFVYDSPDSFTLFQLKRNENA